MSAQAEKTAPLRLSVSSMKRRPRRAFTEGEAAVLRLAADTLIPAKGAYLSGSSVTGFIDLATRAATILDARFEMLEALLAELADIPAASMWDYLEELNRVRFDEFYTLSLIISAAYLNSPEIRSALNYPVPHQNPAGLFEIADELSSGILDPVIERGPVFVSAD